VGLLAVWSPSAGPSGWIGPHAAPPTDGLPHTPPAFHERQDRGEETACYPSRAVRRMQRMGEGVAIGRADGFVGGGVITEARTGQMNPLWDSPIPGED
jgi:hypothetical protein